MHAAWLLLRSASGRVQAILTILIPSRGVLSLYGGWVKLIKLVKLLMIRKVYKSLITLSMGAWLLLVLMERSWSSLLLLLWNMSGVLLLMMTRHLLKL